VDFRPAVADAVALQAALGLQLHRNAGLDGVEASLREARLRLEEGFTLPFALAGEVHP
jgi:hypothetical protein